MASGTSELDELRGRLATSGYHVFLRPDRPTGWWVTIRSAASPDSAPVEARAATRSEALALARRLFTTRRLGELDAAVRAASLRPPSWEGGQQAHLDALERFVREQGLAVPAA